MDTRQSEDRYRKRLLVFLSVASFFEGYDFLALAQLLPNIRADFGLSPSEGATLVTVANAGTIIAYLLVRRANQWGRKRVLAITITGYTLASLASGLAPNGWTFALAQLVARVFLIGEWAIAMVVAAEEFPPEKRGSAMGIIQASASLGSIVCAGLVPILMKLPLGWRTVYFVGAIPLVLVSILRRGMRETSRFTAAQEQGELQKGFFDILKSPHRNQVLQVALVWGLSYICTQNAVTFWKEFAVGERHMSDGDVGLSVTIGALMSLPLIFASGKVLDRVGRRVGSIIIFVATSAGTVAAYQLHSQWGLTLALVATIFGTTAILQVLNAFTAELFPTTWRADAFAWSNNLLGRLGYVFSPLLVGAIAERSNWGLAVSVTAIFPMIALGIILAKFPETRGKQLEN